MWWVIKTKGFQEGYWEFFTGGKHVIQGELYAESSKNEVEAKMYTSEKRALSAMKKIQFNFANVWEMKVEKSVFDACKKNRFEEIQNILFELVPKRDSLRQEHMGLSGGFTKEERDLKSILHREIDAEIKALQTEYKDMIKRVD